MSKVKNQGPLTNPKEESQFINSTQKNINTTNTNKTNQILNKNQQANIRSQNKAKYENSIMEKNNEDKSSISQPKISLRGHVAKKQYSKKDLQVVENHQCQDTQQNNTSITSKDNSSSILQQRHNDNSFSNKKSLPTHVNEQFSYKNASQKFPNQEAKYLTSKNRKSQQQVNFNKKDQQNNANLIKYSERPFNVANNHNILKSKQVFPNNNINSEFKHLENNPLLPHHSDDNFNQESTKNSQKNSFNSMSITRQDDYFHVSSSTKNNHENIRNSETSNSGMSSFYNDQSFYKHDKNQQQKQKHHENEQHKSHHQQFSKSVNIVTQMNSRNSLPYQNNAKSYDCSIENTPKQNQQKFCQNWAQNADSENNSRVKSNQNLFAQQYNQHQNYEVIYNNKNPSNINNIAHSNHQSSNLSSNIHHHINKISFPVSSSSSKTIFLPPNSKSNLIIRNSQQSETSLKEQRQNFIRTKSHTKNYSTYDLNSLNQNIPQFLQNNINKDDSFQQNTLNIKQYQQPHFLNINQKSNLNNQTLNHNQYFQKIQNQKSSNVKSDHPYVFNIISNVNKSTEKTSQLDSIAEKDEFGKVFVRVNQKNQFKSDSIPSTKYIQRQPDTSNKSNKQKINIVSENPKVQYQHAPHYIQINQAPQYANLRYIKGTTINQSTNQPHYIQIQPQKISNHEKYLKVNYQPSIKNERLGDYFVGQNEKKMTQSVNSSFKDSKSETRSLHGNCQNRNSNIDDFEEYYNGEKVNNNFYHKNKNMIEVSNSRNNLHQFKTLPYQKQFHLDKWTQKNKSQYETESFSHELHVANNFHKEDYFNFSKSDHPFLSNNQTRMNSPETKQFVRSGHQNIIMHKSQMQQSDHGQRMTLFSPNQKDIRLIQKNHFLQENQSEKYRQNVRQKKSIKKMLVSQNKGLYNKPEVLVSLNFKDLLKGQAQQSRPNSRTFLEVITKNHITKVFCSTFKIGQNHNGCDCIPKCYWVDQWLDIVNTNHKLKQKSLMKNIDRNKLFNFSGQTLWKNRKNPENGDVKNEMTSFTDYNGLSKLSNDEIQTFKQIEKDIPRTFSSHPTFKNQSFKDFLREVLINSYYLDSKLGYVQGMNIITACIIYHSKTTEQAVRLYDLIMNCLDYKKIYLNDMKKCRDLAAKTCQIIRINCYDMYNHVVIENEVDLEMFIVGWYFSMLGTFVPLQAMHFVINKFIQKQFGGIMKIIVTFFIFIKDTLMQKNDPNQIMQELSVQSMIDRSTKIDWNELISVSEKLKLSFDKQEL